METSVAACRWDMDGTCPTFLAKRDRTFQIIRDPPCHPPITPHPTCKRRTAARKNSTRDKPGGED